MKAFHIMRPGPKQKVNYNPFVNIFEDGASPNAHTLRSHFWKKFQDTAMAFAGRKPNADPVTEETESSLKPHLGIFDYLFLTIPYQIERLNQWLEEPHPHLKSPGLNTFLSLLQGLFSLPVKLIKFAFDLTRYITLFPFLIVSLPFIGIVHLISKIEGDPLKDTVDHWLQAKPNFDNQSELTHELVHLQFERPGGMDNHKIMAYLNQTLANGTTVKFEKELNLENPRDCRVVNALCALNVDGAAGKIRDLGILGANTNHRNDDSNEIIEHDRNGNLLTFGKKK